MAMPSTRTTSADHRRQQRGRRWPSKLRRAKYALRRHGDQPDRGYRRGQADAERDDQQQPVADAVQGDRREEDDERRRAREDPARDPHRDEPADPTVVLVAVAVAVPVVVVVVVVVTVALPMGRPCT